MTRSDFAYAQSRLQARYGRLPDEATWRALEASRTAEHYLSLARAGALAAWTEGLPDAGDAPRVEQHLLTRWQGHVDEVARWLPARWRPAAQAFARLPEVALPNAEAPPDPDAAARWLATWEAALPADGAGTAEADACRRPAELLLPRLQGAESGRPARAEPVRQALMRLFRRRAATAAAVFAYLALAALDVERLRGGLVARSLFGAGEREAA
jgi:hypothetical protein